MIRNTPRKVVLALSIFVASLLAMCSHPAEAQAARYRAELTRIAHAEGGLDAPVALFAAQIEQESRWNPQAVSRVGARGMAQFMPATALWWCGRQGIAQVDCQPSNPKWAMRAMVGYDLWLYQRVYGLSDYDRWWATLRAYNGGLGHWQAEAATVRPSKGRGSIDAACGAARRHISFCAENLGYPRRIMIDKQPGYTGWGKAVLP